MQPIPWFMTHHAPWASAASLTFGLPGHGVSIEQFRPQVGHDADLLVAWGPGPGEMEALPFITGAVATDQETVQMYAAGGRVPTSFREAWRVLGPKEVERVLEPGRDAYRAGLATFEVLSPTDPVPAPGTGDPVPALADALLPAVWLVLTLDNRAGDRPLHGVIGLAHAGPSRMRPLPWEDPAVAGIADGDAWALAARAEPGRVATVRDGSIAPLVAAGTPAVRMCGREGGILLTVPPGEVGTLRACFAFHHGGAPVAQELEGGRSRLASDLAWPSLTAVVRRALELAPGIPERVARDVAGIVRRLPDAGKRALLAQAAQAYRANAQALRRADGAWGYVVTEGGYLWRNTLDLAADHLPWELDRHPWTVGMVTADLATRHSYVDRLRLPGDPVGTFPHAGGLTFCHDQGSAGCESPRGRSGYERSDVTGCYSYMSTEQLLNGAYCIAAAALHDPAWARAHAGLLAAVVESLERRDHPQADRRDGILKATSSAVGATGAEITTYDALDHSLMAAAGNAYIVVKSWCAAELLAEVAARLGDAALEERATAIARRTAAALERAWDARRGALPANLLDPSVPALVPAAVEPLAVPIALGLGHRLAAYPALMGLLSAHLRTCLAACVDPVHGGLRLSSTSANTWPSKAALVLRVAEHLGIDLDREFPRAWPGVADWMQRLAAAGTCADQIDIGRQTVVGAYYYPRLVTLAALLAPAQEARPLSRAGGLS